MMGRMLALSAALIAAAVMTGRAGEMVEIHLNGRYFSEPATVQMIIAVEPDDANRVLRVEADSDQMFRSSEISLEGRGEKRLHTVEFKNLPAGEYELRAEVLGTNNNVRGMASQDLMVMGGGR
jgi:uncharacterized protein YfaS (alpha-2-macroglobulin family)